MMVGVSVMAFVILVIVLAALLWLVLRRRADGPAHSRFGLDRANAAAGAIARIAEVLLWIAAAVRALLVVLFIAVPGSFETDPDGFSVTYAAGPVRFVLDGDLLDYQSRFVKFGGEPADLWPVLLIGLGGLVVYAGGAWLFHQISGLCDDLRHWEPQREDIAPIWTSIADRMRICGWCLIALPLVVFAVMACVGLAGYAFNCSLGISALLVMFGIIVLMLGRVFEYGMGLQREVDGLL